MNGLFWYVLTYNMYGPCVFSFRHMRTPSYAIETFVQACERDYLGACFDNCLYKEGVLVARQATYNGVS